MAKQTVGLGTSANDGTGDSIRSGGDKVNPMDLLPKDKNQLVVAYCGGPGCGAYRRGADAAAKLGFKNVKHLSAGISGWKKSGAPIEN